MAKQIERKSLSEELGRLVSGSRVHAALFSTFTFGRQFFETEVLGQITEDFTRLGNIPITVVVDRNQYRGSGWGYQVIRPPRGRLWHAKIILMMLTGPGDDWQQTILGLGSANLTRNGWEENDELFSFRTWSDWCVPKILDEELLKSGWFHSAEFAVWCKENNVTPKSSSKGIRLLSNASGTPLWEQLLGPHRHKGWDEAHVVAPFTERVDLSDAEPGGRTKHFFQQLAQTAASKNSTLHVYVTSGELDATSSNHVVADGPTFNWLYKQPLKLRMHILQPECKGRFHAKLFAFKAGGRWSVIAGSANATGAAMTSEDGNVEMVYEWKDVGRSLPSGLMPASRPVALTNLTFTKPKFANATVWNAVERAVYIPTRKRLQIYWSHAHGLHDTRLLINERRIDPFNFTLTDRDDPYLQSVPKRKQLEHSLPGFVPIEVPPILPHEISSRSNLTPEEWLDLVGRHECQFPPAQLFTVVPSTHSRKARFTKGGFDWAEKVSRLDQCLATLKHMISECTSSKEMKLIEKLLLGIWNSHNPAESGVASSEAAWRKWVRCGVWQVISLCDKRYSVCKPLSTYQTRWQKRLPKTLKELPIAPA